MKSPSSNSFNIARAKLARGFTLLEILISIVVLSFGLLALAALQLKTLQFSQGANSRTIASNLASTLADQMLVNRLAITNGAYNKPSDTETTACFTASGCSAAQLANENYHTWLLAIAQQLGPTAGGMVCIDSTPNDTVSGSDPTIDPNPKCDGVAGAPYVIYVWWQDNRIKGAAAVGAYQRFSTSIQP